MLKFDCRYFNGDKPCVFNKTEGIVCDDCNHYSPIKMKILIVKLDAIGDVLRTTSILPPLKKKYPDSYITWCTRKSATQLFSNNKFVDEVIVVEDDAYFRIKTEKYDQVINLDTSKISSSIAAMANAKMKTGFVLNEKGFVEPASEAANVWLEMSAFDNFKRANTKSYQQIMYDILEFSDPISEPQLFVSVETKKEISERLKQHGLNNKLKTIGLNIGVGPKWPSKGWPEKNWILLIKSLVKDNYNLLLLGGPEEKEKIIQLKKKFPFLIDTGTDNSVMEFAAIVNECDLIITCDTFALHIATAMNKKIIVLVGSTSAAELYLYKKGVKLTPSFECKCFYERNCTEEISCMESISPDSVLKEIERIL
jgi:lipopolysaccharide heptosyltransferase III